MDRRLPKCQFLYIINNKMELCNEPAEYWDCGEPIGGPVCFKHCCKRCSGKDGRKLEQDELDAFIAKEDGYEGRH